MRLFLLLIFLNSPLFCFSNINTTDTLFSHSITEVKSSDISIIKTLKPLDSILIRNNHYLLLYFLPCKFQYAQNDTETVNQPAKLIVLDSTNRFSIFQLPSLLLECPEDYANTSVTVSHKQINGYGLPELIINWNYSLCGASGVLCEQYYGVSIIDIENYKCILNSITEYREENNSGRYDGSSTIIRCKRIITFNNKKIVIKNIKCECISTSYNNKGNETKVTLKGQKANDLFLKQAGSNQKLFIESPGVYRLKNQIFVK